MQQQLSCAICEKKKKYKTKNIHELYDLKVEMKSTVTCSLAQHLSNTQNETY